MSKTTVIIEKLQEDLRNVGQLILRTARGVSNPWDMQPGYCRFC
jgi:hypothetical protein